MEEKALHPVTLDIKSSGLQDCLDCCPLPQQSTLGAHITPAPLNGLTAPMIAAITVPPLTQMYRRHLKPSKSKSLGSSRFYLIALCSGPCLNASRSLRAPRRSHLLTEAFLDPSCLHCPFLYSNLAPSLGPCLLSWQNHHCLSLFVSFLGYCLCSSAG